MTKFTTDEHICRAMLLGMKYHHGNGDHFYYVPDEDGSPKVISFTDPDTLEPFVPAVDVMDDLLAKSKRPKEWR
jgi:hypothetical protein